MWDIADFASRYSLDELCDNLQQHDTTIDQLTHWTVEEAFQFAVQKGLVDVVEYLYVWHEVTYELIQTSMQILDPDQPPPPDQEVVVHDPSAPHGLKLNVLSKQDIWRERSMQKLYALRRYSSMKTYDKKFYYQFKTKYRYKFPAIK